MQHAVRPSALVPDGLAVESAIRDGGSTLITVAPYEQDERDLTRLSPLVVLRDMDGTSPAKTGG